MLFYSSKSYYILLIFMINAHIQHRGAETIPNSVATGCVSYWPLCWENNREGKRETENTRAPVPSFSTHGSSSSHASLCEKNWLQSFRKHPLHFTPMTILHQRRAGVPAKVHAAHQNVQLLDYWLRPQLVLQPAGRMCLCLQAVAADIFFVWLCVCACCNLV